MMEPVFSLKYFFLSRELFNHLSTAHLARMMSGELQKKHTNKTITDQEILCLEVAGLCHDLG